MYRLAWILAAGALAAGCSAHNYNWSCGSTSSGGLSVTHLSRDGRMWLVLAAAGCTGTGSSSGSGPGGSWVQGELRAAGGRKVAWSCQAADGGGGAVTVDGRPFDLAKGGLLLVSLRDNKTEVEQLAVDMAKLQRTSVVRDLRDLAEAEPRLAAFLKGAQAAK